MKTHSNKIILVIAVIFIISGVVVFNLFANNKTGNSNGIIFPQPFAFAIDDMGWNIGNNDGDVDKQGPYRIGIDRNMDIDDYKCIVEVGQKVGTRIQGLFVLAEFDRENILAKDPTTTWLGKKWDNTKNVNSHQIDIMNYVKESAAYLEFGLHGVGHEYWVDGTKKRAEWYCTDDNYPWPQESLEQHVSLFKDIMAQYGISEQNGHSFPESFVPCAYGYYWNPNGLYSTGKVVANAGVKYVNTLFDYITELNPPAEPNGGGFDNGVVVVNRINYGNPWYALSSLPNVSLASQQSNIIESHWSNWLAQDKFLQSETNQQWVDYYMMVQADSLRYVAKNTEQFNSQWLYNKYTVVTENQPGTVNIDNTNMPQQPYKHKLLGNMVLKIKLAPDTHISHASIDGDNICAYFEQQGYGFIYLPVLSQKKYTLNYKVGTQKMPVYIYNKGTYNVYSLSTANNNTIVDIRIYGTQEVDFFGVSNPKNIRIDNKKMALIDSNYDNNQKHLTLKLKAHNIQGETARIALEY